MRATVDGNEAAASVAYRLNEVCCIYPITPSSPMAELADEWASQGRPNVWGTVPAVVEMQSEGGAAGALHGALQSGALATTFTASQGLLLMIPNMYKIAGELTPAVLHVAARSLAAQGLSIFGDHSDVMAVRQTGFALLASASVQEAHDLALVAQAATLQTRVPFVHFFDGFRTSHELNTIELLSDDDLRALVPEELVRAHRGRALSPERPFIRGTAQNPDVYFQARETVNPFYARVPDVVEDAMARLAERTGRRYHVVDYTGHPEAERVLVVMGSGGETVQETVASLNARGERVGVVQVRLYRPFPAQALVEALPATVRRIAVLDRTKEPGSIGEPLFLDTVAALTESSADGERAVMPRVVGGRYGLSSKEFTPGMVAGVFDELAAERPRRRFTIGITDDVSGTSLTYDASLDIEPPETVRAIFFGLGSDGTVGANKNTIKILGAEEGLHAQGYFVYDSKKSGSQTVSHLRFGPQPIRAPYLVQQASFVGCHQFGLLDRVDVLGRAADGATLLLNCPHAAGRGVGCAVPPGPGADPRQAHRRVRDRRRPDRARGRPRRTDQHRPADLLLRHLRRVAARAGDRPDQGSGRQDLRPARRRGGRTQPGRGRPRAGRPAPGRGARAGDGHPRAAAGRARARARVRPHRHRGDDGRPRRRPAGQRAAGGRHVSERHDGLREAQHLGAGRGLGLRPVHPVRQLQLRLPAQRDPLQVLRPVPPGGRTGRVPVGSAGGRRPARHPLHAAGLRRGLHRLRAVRRGVPGRRAGRPGPQGDQPRTARAAGRRRAGQHRVLRDAARERPVAGRLRHGARHPVPGAAVRVLRRLRGLRRDAVPEAPLAAVRRPADGRQRDRLLVDLRRQPADHAVDDRRRRARPGLVELPLRGQRRVRARLPARRRPAHRAGPPAPCRAARRGRRGAGGRHPGCAATAGVGAARAARAGGRAEAAARRAGRSRRHRPAQRRRSPGPAQRLDRRRRRLGLRHRLRRARPRPGQRAQRQRAGARHRGLLQHRRPDVQGDAARRGRQVRRRRQDRAQEGPRPAGDRLRQRLRRPGRDGRRSPADAERLPRGGGLRRPVAGARLQPLHRARHRHARTGSTSSTAPSPAATGR